MLAKEALNGLEPRDVDRGYRWEQGFTLEMYMHEDSQKARDAFVDTGKAAEVLMDLAYTPEQHAFRAEVRAWLAAHVPAEPLSTLERARRLRPARRMGAHARQRQLGHGHLARSTMAGAGST